MYFVSLLHFEMVLDAKYVGDSVLTDHSQFYQACLSEMMFIVK